MNRSLIAILHSALLLAAMASTALARADCTPKHAFDTLSPGVLTVAAWVFPPYSIPGPGHRLGGVDGEIITRIAARECLTLKVTVLDPAAVIQSVISGRADVGIGDWYRTTERSRALGLSAPLYLDKMGIISAEGYSQIAQLDGKRIGTVQGYLWVDDLKKAFGDNLVLYPNPVAMAQDLASRRIEVGADSFAVGIASQRKGAYKGKVIKVSEPDPRIRATLQPGQTGFPFTRTNAALEAALNANIQAMHEAGEIADILVSFGLDRSAADVGPPRMIE